MEPGDSSHSARQRVRRDPRAAPIEIPELPEIPFDVFCQECGYNLRGLTGDNCPECGRSLEWLRSPIEQIPWVHRKELGLFRAYWATVRMATSDRKRLCEEMVRPVSYADAQRFRWVTILHVYVPILIGTSLLYVVESKVGAQGVFKDSFIRTVIQAGWPFAFLNACFVLFLAAVTGMPSYFFHPRNIPLAQQNRAVAISYYACAPLAYASILLGIVLIGLWANISEGAGYFAVTLIIAVAMLGILGQRWWSNLIFIARRAIPQRKGRGLLVGLSFPVLFVALCTACLVVPPLLVFYVAIIVSSLG